ncbi:hypothetical protein MUK42_31982 [Musa troglodytarum]|uniref:Transmembrane protein 184C n=2 Tax=Musa troglodytarum TaxID=320322 RepID=A0A9E7F138_9LILI|nr:hypothetical protein MUK42_31982 [Musa troglodytarum]
MRWVRRLAMRVPSDLSLVSINTGNATSEASDWSAGMGPTGGWLLTKETPIPLSLRCIWSVSSSHRRQRDPSTRAALHPLGGELAGGARGGPSARGESSCRRVAECTSREVTDTGGRRSSEEPGQRASSEAHRTFERTPHRLNLVPLCPLLLWGSTVECPFINSFENTEKAESFFVLLRRWGMALEISLILDEAMFPQMDLTKMDPGTLTLLGAACCVILTMHFTVQLLSQHLFYWKNPKEQKAIIVIILMAPLYAIDSFVGLVDIQGSKAFFTFLDSVKECYEALVIAKFMALMYSYLNISLSKNTVPDEIKGREIHHSFPVSLFLPHTIRLEHHTLKLLKYWTWQFVVIRPICSILMIALQLLGLYTTWISWTFTIILNISVSMALYALVIFYHVFAKELAPHKPLTKFMCIKGIVFFCFWQGVALDVLATAGVIQSHHFWLDVEHIEEVIQNVLVILEMVVFSVLQQYAYNVAPYTGVDAGKSVSDKKNE